MTPWTEGECFSLMLDKLKQAASDCDTLAGNRRKGIEFNRLRHDLQTIEGMCRIVFQMRADARWLKFGLVCARAHANAAEWLRGVPQRPDRNGRRPPKPLPESVRHPLFLKLAEFLRHTEAEIVVLRTARTNRVGMILPKPLQPNGVRFATNYRLMPLRKTPGGVILP